MTILAIDPGTDKSAWLFWNGQTVQYPRIVLNETLLETLRECQSMPLSTLLAVEMVASYGMPVGKEVFETVLWIGRFVEVWESKGGSFLLVYRRDVKLHHCGSARAKDANIRQALIDKYGKPGTKKEPGALYGISSHLWSALAVATYVSETAANNTKQ